MSPHDQNGILDEVRRVFRRRRRLILAIAGATAAVGALVIASIPDVYASHSVVVVEPGNIHVATKQPTASVPPLSELIGTLRRAVLARDVLRQVVANLELYGAAPGGAAGVSESTIARARKDIQINIARPDDQQYLEISARARTPELAQRAVARMADLLGAKNRELRIERAEEVKAYIEGELAKAEAAARAREAELLRFREENHALLPENAPAISARLRELTLAADARARRADEIQAELKAAQLGLGPLLEPVAAVPFATAPLPLTPLEAAERDLDDAQRRDVELEIAGYRPSWPDRQVARRRIERLEAQVAGLRARAAGGAPAMEGGTRPAALPAGAAARAVPAAAPSVPPAARGRYVELAQRIETRKSELVRLQRETEQSARERASLEEEAKKVEAARAELEKLTSAYRDQQQQQRLAEDDLRTIRKFLDIERASQGDQLRTIEAAEVPAAPAAPNRPLLLAIALLAAFGLGGGTAYLVELTASTFRSQDELEEELGVKVLAAVPAEVVKGGGKPGDLLYALPEEELGKLRHAVLHHPRVRGVRSILVTSAVAGEGKTTLACGLGRAVARSLDHRAVVVEADLRRPGVLRLLGREAGRGLAEHILHGATLEDTLTDVPKLSAIAAGRCAGDPAHVIASERMRRLAAALPRQGGDLVVIYDAPPVLAAPEPLSLAEMVDGVVLVVRAESTTRAAVKRALGMLPAGKVLGVVLNGAWFGGDERAVYYPSDRASFWVVEEPGMLDGKRPPAGKPRSRAA